MTSSLSWRSGWRSCAQDKLLEVMAGDAHQLRHRDDPEMGFCSGIENYPAIWPAASRRSPLRLIDYFPDDFLLIVDESQTIPQVRGMYNGTGPVGDTGGLASGCPPPGQPPSPVRRVRTIVHQVIYTSATPASYELQRSSSGGADHPSHRTGGPEVVVRRRGQIDDLVGEISAGRPR